MPLLLYLTLLINKLLKTSQCKLQVVQNKANQFILGTKPIALSLSLKRHEQLKLIPIDVRKGRQNFQKIYL